MGNIGSQVQVSEVTGVYTCDWVANTNLCVFCRLLQVLQKRLYVARRARSVTRRDNGARSFFGTCHDFEHVLAIIKLASGRILPSNNVVRRVIDVIC